MNENQKAEALKGRQIERELREYFAQYNSILSVGVRRDGHGNPTVHIQVTDQSVKMSVEEFLESRNFAPVVVDVVRRRSTSLDGHKIIRPDGRRFGP